MAVKSGGETEEQGDFQKAEKKGIRRVNESLGTLLVMVNTVIYMLLLP